MENKKPSREDVIRFIGTTAIFIFGAFILFWGFRFLWEIFKNS
jgi:hypothetical protein